MSERRCTNCKGTLKMFPDRRLLICEYCDSEFEISPQDKKDDSVKANKQQSLAQQLFDLSSAGSSFPNEHCKTAFTETCVWINNGNTVETCLLKLADISKQYSEWATIETNAVLMETVKFRIFQYLSINEIPLFYKDSGVISKGKTGMLITNQQIIYFKKNAVNTVSLSEITSIHFETVIDTGQCYFNSSKAVRIDNMVCTSAQQGAIAALVCILVRECHEKGYKIRVFMNK